jgi:hypothetical protein
MKLTLHVTDLDGYLWYQRMEDMTAADFAKRLKHEGPTNDKMLKGTAWHKVLENPPGTIDTIEKDGFTFKVDCDRAIVLPQVREIRASKTYHVAGVDVTLTGGCDGITGNVVIDHKLSFNPELENYFESYQWRAYLDIYNADIFRYYVYSAKGDGTEITIKDVLEFAVFRYPGMVSYLEQGIFNVVSFIKLQAPEMIQA